MNVSSRGVVMGGITFCLKFDAIANVNSQALSFSQQPAKGRRQHSLRFLNR